VFVVKKDIIKNELIVGTGSDEELFEKNLKIYEMNFLSKNIDFPFTGKAKIRYRQSDQDVVVHKIEDGYRVDFESPQRAIASGQICAIYDENDILLMSGVIV
jgi:tRNA-specific 2-thiouridylase